MCCQRWTRVCGLVFMIALLCLAMWIPLDYFPNTAPIKNELADLESNDMTEVWMSKTRFASPRNWRPPVLPEHLSEVDQFNRELIQHIRQKWVIPPFDGPQNVSRTASKSCKKDFSSGGQPTVINDILRNMTNGFFLESGAADGEYISNSLWFELHRNWTGILIEANPIYFQSMLNKNRHAYMINACLSPERRPMLLQFTVDGEGGGITDLVSKTQKRIVHTPQKRYTPIQCFPLYSIMAAIGVTHVNYFSLDIEGAEIPVLRTIPYDRLRIDSFTIEKRVIDEPETTKRKASDIEDILLPLGYQVDVPSLLYDIVLSRSDLHQD